MTIRAFSQGPYYDDFSDSKEFHRILFKPGVAVQARELTQLQSILQTQIDRFGQNIFQDGSMVVGGKTAVDFKVRYLKINKTYNSNPVDPTTLLRILKGTTATAAGIPVARVFTYADTGDGYWTLLYKEESDAAFTKNDVLIYQPDPAVAGTNVAQIINVDNIYTGKASTFAISAGIYYTRGSFVLVPDQVIPLAYDVYSGSTVIFHGDTPSVRVGLNIVESIVDSDLDSSLLDPALGSYNYNAPGADRYKIDLQLVAPPLLKQAVIEAVVDNGTGIITSLVIVDGGSGYPTVGFASTVITFTGSSDDPSSASALVASVDSHTGTITALTLVDGGSGFTQSRATVTVALPPDSITNFIEVARFDAGVTIKTVTVPLYSVIGDVMAGRTYDESGDYTVNPFTIQVSDDTGFPDKFNINIGPGRAYVRGYQIDQTSTLALSNDRARDATHQKTVTDYQINPYYGNYIVVVGTDITKSFDPTTEPLVFFRDEVSSVIGVGRLVSITGDIISPISYQFHFADVRLTGNQTDIRSFELTSDGSTTAAVTAPNAIFLNSSSRQLFFNLPQRNIKTIGDTVSMWYQLAQSGTIASDAVTVTSTGGIEYWPTSGILTDKDNSYIVYDTTDNVVLDLTSIYISTITGMTSSATFSGFSGLDGHDVVIISRVFLANIAHKSKTLVSNATEIHTPISTDTTITLSHPDGVTLHSVTAGATDYTDRFSFDNGMRDDKYDYARLVLKSGNTMPLTALTIVYDYFSHGSTGHYFSVDSYPDYDTIPIYTAMDGSAYPLDDVLDFRWSVTGTNPLIPDPNEPISLTFSYYVGRIDRLVLTKQGTFTILKGIPDLNPQVPPSDPISMNIATMSIAPYTLNVKQDVKFTLVDNKRYTMRDIGVLDNRIGRLEYYNSLSLLELSSQSLLILDSTGNDRFKNGTLVDNFQGQSIGDVTNPDYYAATNCLDQYMTCPTLLENYVMRLNNATRTQAAMRNKMLTLDYTVIPMVTQGQASSTVSVNPFNVVTYVGKLALSPDSDFWVDTGQLPDVVVNKNGENDQFEPWPILTSSNNSAVLAEEHAIQTFCETNKYHTLNQDGVIPAGSIIVQGHFLAPSPSIAVSSSGGKSGAIAPPATSVQTSPAFNTITKSTSKATVNTSLIPFMRQNAITFAATGMKPNTQLYTFFDGVDVGNNSDTPGGVTTRSEVLSVSKVSGGADVPTIAAFTYPFGAPTVAQDTGSGTATGTVIMVANGLIHVTMDVGSVDFIVSSDPTKQVELRYVLQTPSGVQELNNYNFEVMAVSLPSTGGASTFKTDLFGNISGVFAPGAGFYVGDRILELLDVNALAQEADAFTLAKAYFHSGGLQVSVPPTPTVIATRPPQPVVPDFTNNVFFDSPPASMGLDPLAQSFFVSPITYPNGLFLDSVDLCFLNKDTTAPVQIELRPMTNGTPDSNIVIPGSVVTMTPDQVNVTNLADSVLIPSFDNPATYTRFVFANPICLQAGVWYAVIVISTSNAYDAYVAEIGAIQIGTSSQITSQPYAGSLFESQNADTWTPDQTKDLMFRLNQCKFDSSGSVTLVLDADRDGLTQSSAFDFDELWMTTTNIEFNGIATASYAYKSTDTTDTLDSSSTPFTASQDVQFVSRRELNSYSTDVNAVTSQTTYATPSGWWAAGVNIDCLDIAVRASADATIETLVPKTAYTITSAAGGTLTFTGSVYPLPTTGQVIRFVRQDSFQVDVSMATSDDNISPMIDLTQLTCRFIQNQINNGGITAASIAGTPINVNMRTPYITLTTSTGSAAVLFCVMSGGSLVDVVVSAPGSGYVGGDTATIVSTQSPPPGTVATIDLVLGAGGAITGATITNPGAGYDTPSVYINSGTGSGAQVYPVITQSVDASETSGILTSIDLINGGSNYFDNFTAFLVYATEDGGGEYLSTASEESFSGGNCITRYICRRVTLDDGFDAEDIRVYLTAMKPLGTGVNVYYKVLSSADGTLWSDAPYVLMQSTGDVQSASLADYKDMEFRTTGGSTAYGVFTNYKMFAVKVVLTTANTVSVPRIQGLRVIAVDTTY